MISSYEKNGQISFCFVLFCFSFLKTIRSPSRYEAEFFHNVVNGHYIVSWGAVDQSRPHEQSDELIGFVTVRIVPAKESEVSLGGVDCIRCLALHFTMKM